jgi:hypothetical protein
VGTSRADSITYCTSLTAELDGVVESALAVIYRCEFGVWCAGWRDDGQMSKFLELVSAVPDKKRIYHYTSQAGLLGIVQSKALWASSIRHLNDSVEFGYSIELVRENLGRRLGAERGPWNGFYGEVLNSLGAVEGQMLFVASFSEEGDLLSQWRAYTPNAIGFSLGFESRDLLHIAAGRGFGLLRCVYDRLEQDALLDDLIDTAGNDAMRQGALSALEAFLLGFYMLAPAFKHPSFSEEREWRLVSGLVSPDDAATKFRRGKSMLIPYSEIELTDDRGKMPIGEIIVGPTPHMHEAITSVRYLAISRGLASCRVEGSRTPYRAW